MLELHHRIKTSFRIAVAGAVLSIPLVGIDSASGAGPPRLTDSDRITALVISPRERLPLTKRLTIGRNKTVMLSFPYELRDVVISAPELMDAVVQTSSRVFLIGKDKAGQTNALFFNVQGELLLTLEITIERDITELVDIFRETIPGARITARMMNDSIILRGTVPSAQASHSAVEIAGRFVAKSDGEGGSKKVVNMLVIEADEQVMLHVMVAEVQRTALKQLGINLGAVLQSGNLSTTVLTDNALPLTAAQGLGALLPFTVDQAGKLTTKSNGTTAAWSSNGQQGSATVRALERAGLIRTLAEPTLTTVSGEAAKFIAGGEYPVTTSVANGQTAVSFKEYGVSVAFTPVVLTEGRISMKIDTGISDLTNEGAVTMDSITISALKKRSVTSTVELPSGGSLAIAGLISETVRQNVDGLPGLKDVPILGTLFRSRDFVLSETEMVVIVTPYVVRPTSRARMSAPTDGLAPASDLKANALGHINRVHRAPQPSVRLLGGREPQFIVD